MDRRNRGFTLIEMVIVVVIGAILTSMALNSFSGVQGRASVRQARGTFASLHARTRASAIEFGETTRLIVDMDNDSVAIRRGTTSIEKVRFDEALGVDILGTGTLTLCMNPRGFAETACNSFSTTQTVTFQAGTDTAQVQIRTLGQLTY